MDLGFNLAPSNRDLKDPTSRQNFGDTSGLLCKNDPILRLKDFKISNHNGGIKICELHCGVQALTFNLSNNQICRAISSGKVIHHLTVF